MKHIKIGTNKESLDSLNILTFPNVWISTCGGARFCDTEDYQPSIIDGVFSPYADFSIELVVANPRYPVGNALIENVLGDVQLCVGRHNKSINSAWLNTQAKKLGLENFRHLDTSNSNRTFIPQFGKRYIVKPELGARSLGQVIYDPSETTLSSILNCIAADEQEAAKQILALPGAPVYVAGDENTEHEGIRSLKEGSYSQEYVPNVENEYRVILKHKGEVGYSILRERTKHGQVSSDTVATASGAKQAIGDATYCLPPELKVHESEITRLLDAANFELYAFDFFTTADGKWGIFEFAPQCGTAAVPDGFIQQEAKLYVEALCRKVGLL